jgi:hypothetical protein
MGKLPIEKNYGGRMEELDSQPYLSEGISRRGFLKGAAALTGAAIFGEGFLKQMEAWAQDGVSVYIDNFLIGGDIPEGKYQNVDKTIPRELAKILKRNGINVLTNPEYITNDTIIISGTFTYSANDHTMPRISDGSPFFMDSIKISVEYENGGSLIDSNELKYDWRLYPDPMLGNLGREMSNYIGSIRSKRRISRTEQSPLLSQTRDEIVMEIDGKRRRLKKAIMNDNVRKLAEAGNEKIIKLLEEDGFKIIDKQIYKIID